MLQTGNSGNRAKSQDSIEVRATRALSHEAAVRKARLSARDERRLAARLIEEFEELQYGSLVMDTFQAFKGVVA